MARLLMNTTRSNPNGTHKMSERIKELVERYNREIDPCYPDANRETLMRFAQDTINRIQARMPLNIQIVKVITKTTVDIDPV